MSAKVNTPSSSNRSAQPKVWPIVPRGASQGRYAGSSSAFAEGANANPFGGSGGMNITCVLGIFVLGWSELKSIGDHTQLIKSGMFFVGGRIREASFGVFHVGWCSGTEYRGKVWSGCPRWESVKQLLLGCSLQGWRNVQSANHVTTYYWCTRKVMCLITNR